MNRIEYDDLNFQNLSRSYRGNEVLLIDIPSRHITRAKNLLLSLQECFTRSKSNYPRRVYLSIKLVFLMFTLIFLGRRMRSIPGFYIVYQPHFRFLKDGELEFS